MSRARVIKDLQTVEDLITKNGWCRGSSQDDRGRYCLIGAAAVAVGKKPVDNYGGGPRHDALLNAMGAALPEDFYTRNDTPERLFRWNDNRASDKRAVLRLIRRARRRLEREEQEAAA